MKCQLNIPSSSVLLLCLSSSWSFAMNQEISAENINKIHLRSGDADPNLIIPKEEREKQYQDQYKLIYSASIKNIRTQSKKVKRAAPNFAMLKELLPREFHNPQILKLANDVQFSHGDDVESRAWKFVRLALLISDMYDKDNSIAKNLGLLDPTTKKISPIELSWLVTESLDHAVKDLESIEKVPSEREIDFELSIAEVHLLKLRHSRLSFAHLLADFAVVDGALILGAHSKQTVKAIHSHLEKARSLLEDQNAVLPTRYQQDLCQMAKNLSPDEKYELIKAHKQELDNLRLTDTDDKFAELNKARGLIDFGDNPLYYFTEEILEVIESSAMAHGAREDQIEQIKENTIKIYAIKKILNPEVYFHQDVLQRFLENSGKISHEALKEMLLVKIDNVKKAATAVYAGD